MAAPCVRRGGPARGARPARRPARGAAAVSAAAAGGGEEAEAEAVLFTTGDDGELRRAEARAWIRSWQDRTAPAARRAGPAAPSAAAKTEVADVSGLAWSGEASTAAIFAAGGAEGERGEDDAAAAARAQLLALLDGVPEGETSEEADACIARLAAGREAAAAPAVLEDPRLFGLYEVVYTSKGAAQKGQPAGGRFTSKLGKRLFRPRGLFQHLYPPSAENSGAGPEVVNAVAFSLFGVLPGLVLLRGDLQPQEDDWARVSFDPPLLQLGNLRVRLGPPTSVELQSTFVDAELRLGKGSLGSLFAFRRLPAGSDAEVRQAVRAGPSPPAALAAAAAGLVAAAAVAARLLAAPAARALGLAAAAALVGVALVLRRGGTEQDERLGETDGKTAAPA